MLGVVAFACIAPSLGIALTGEFPFLAVGPEAVSAVSPEVLAATEEIVPVIIFTTMGPVRRMPTASVYALAEQEVMAVSVRLMTVYNFAPYRYSPLFGMAAGWLPRDKIDQVFADPGVRSIDYDRPITTALASTPGVTYLSLDEVIALNGVGIMWAKGWLGQGVKVAYLDSGAPAHAVEALSVDNASPNDFYGHGTMVHDVLSRLAPSAHLVSVKVLDDYGSGRISSVIKGLEVAVMSGAHVVNMSLGAPAAAWDSLGEAAGLASQYYGVKIFAASGNVGELGTLSPARSDKVVSVGAVDVNMAVTPYSSRGKVETVGFGDVYAMWLGQVKPVSGTSCASPQAAALYAVWLSGHPESDIGRIDQFAVVRSASLDLPPEGWNRYTGWGLLSGQALAATEPEYMPPLWETLVLPMVLLAVVLFIVAGIVVWRSIP